MKKFYNLGASWRESICLFESSHMIHYIGRTVTNADITCGPTHLLVFSGNRICLDMMHVCLFTYDMSLSCRNWMQFLCVLKLFDDLQV